MSKQKSDKITKILVILKLSYPESTITLDFKSPFQLLVATILSAQSTDTKVNQVTPELFEKYPSALAMSYAKYEDLIVIIKPIGLYNSKSKSIIKTSKILVEKYKGNVPDEMNKLVSLPGVGRKTANVVLGNAFDIKDSGITVDTHMKRLSIRIGLTTETKPLKIEADLMKIVPVEDWMGITHLFISHGRKVCGRKPHCELCSISELCKSAFKFSHFKD